MREKWQKGAKTLVSSQLEIMEKSYVKYHNYLALALHNAVQTKDADYCKSLIFSILQSLRDTFQAMKPNLSAMLLPLNK